MRRPFEHEYEDISSDGRGIAVIVRRVLVNVHQKKNLDLQNWLQAQVGTKYRFPTILFARAFGVRKVG